MGLDMVAFKTHREIEDHGFQREDCDIQIQYWRKHPNLHGWMEWLYRMKGGVEEFNCVGIKIEKEDIDILEKLVLTNELHKTEGFFFGVSQPEDKELDVEFILLARKAIDEGYSIYYSSWW